jgi:hypothetical protein
LAAGVEPEFPEEAIAPFFSQATGERLLPVRVALKDAAKAIKAIDAAFPKAGAPRGPQETAPPPAATPQEKREAAEAALESIPVEPEPVVDPEVLPSPAVERQAKRALSCVLMSVMLPGFGATFSLLGMTWAWSARNEIMTRPQEQIGGLGKANLALGLGVFLTLAHLAAAVAAPMMLQGF